MHFSDREQNEVNVVSLFRRAKDESALDYPINELLSDTEVELESPREVKARKVVNENQFPDQAMYILEEQLRSLKSNLNRIKFYLGEVDDLLQK